MIGTDEITGKVLRDESYARQCARRALKTNKYSMLMHRNIGIDLPPFIALPTSDIWMLSLTGEIAQGIESLLPSVNVKGVEAEASDGNLRANVSINWQDSNFKVTNF